MALRTMVLSVLLIITASESTNVFSHNFSKIRKQQNNPPKIAKANLLKMKENKG